MAIKVDFTKVVAYASQDGDVINQEKVYPAAYCRVASYNGVKNIARYEVEIYDNDAAENLIQRISFEFFPSVAEGSENLIKQAYNHLKTRPQFAGGEDC